MSTGRATYVTRPPVLQITHRAASRRFACPYIDDLRQAAAVRGEAGAVVSYTSPACTLPALIPVELFKQFDFVICSLLPKELCDAGGIIYTSRLTNLNFVESKRRTLCFYAGFVEAIPPPTPRSL